MRSQEKFVGMPMSNIDKSVQDTSSFHVAKYDRVYLNQIEKLWREQFDSEYIEKRRILFQWLTERNPFSGPKSPYFLLVDREKVIGMHGHMPLLFSVNGKEKEGYLAHDDLIAREYRGKGLGRKMLEGVSEKCRSFSGALWFNEPNYRSYLKSGWLDIPDFYSFIRILDPTYFIKNRIKSKIFQKAALPLAKGLVELRGLRRHITSLRGVSVSEIKGFDQNFDSFFERVAHHFGIIVVRNQKYLNWKFVEKPFSNYKSYAAFDQKGELSGYSVIKKQIVSGKVIGKILDILAQPDKPEAFAALIKKNVEEFSKINSNYIEIICTYRPFIKILRRLGFIRARKLQRFMVSNWKQGFEQEFIGRMENWYLTLSDADGDSWEVDFKDPW